MLAWDMSHLPISMATASIIAPAVQLRLPWWAVAALLILAAVEAWAFTASARWVWRWLKRNLF